MIWILNNIRLLSIVAWTIFAFIFGMQTQAKISDHNKKVELENQRRNLTAQCESDKKLTSEVSNEYQNKISQLNARVISLKRMHKDSCLQLTRTTDGHNAATSGAVDAAAHGVDVESLLDYGSDAEKYRLQLIGCQDFIKKVWNR